MAALLRDQSSGREWILDQGDSWLVGRGPDATIRITDAKSNARIEFADGGWFASGGALNGAPLYRDELRSGDVLSLGESRLLFLDDGVPPRPDAPDASPKLPVSYEALLAIAGSAPDTIDAALIVARACEKLLRHADRPERRASLKSVYAAGIESRWPVVRAVSAHGIAALAALGTLDAREATGRIEPLLSDPADFVQGSAARALAKVDPLAAAPRLFARALGSLDGANGAPEARAAAGALTDAVPSGPLIDALRESAEAAVLDATGPSSRRAAGSAALGELAAAGDARAIRPLRFLLADGEPPLRASAAAGLARAARSPDTAVAQDAHDALIGALDDPSAAVFHEAWAGLSGRRDAAVATALLDALRRVPRDDAERRARLRRALEDATGERRGPDPDAWLRG